MFVPRTGRAVRCVLERGEDMLITGARHPVLGKYKVLQSVPRWLEVPTKVASEGRTLPGCSVSGGFQEGREDPGCRFPVLRQRWKHGGRVPMGV